MLLLGVFIIAILLPMPNLSKNDQNKNDNLSKALDLSGYYNLTGSRILIDDSDPNYNWSKTATENPWCNGIGTWSDPYTIENVTIDGQGWGSCITIRNSKVPFLIKNCTLYNAGTDMWNFGIHLEDSSNGTLLENRIFNIHGGESSGPPHGGISLIRSYNNTISNNWVNSTFLGIELQESNKTLIIGNELFNDTAAILVLDSNNNFITQNLIDSQDFYNALSISSDASNNSIIFNNTIINTRTGIQLADSINAIVEQNIIQNVSQTGIRTGRSNFSICVRNTISHIEYGYTTTYGINSRSPNKGNLFYNNYISGFDYNGADDGVNNSWDNGTIGNYYSDYGGIDANDDGIGDSPYIIFGAASSQDNFPIWWDAPTIEIVSPVENQAFELSSPEFTLSIEGIEDSLWYSLNDTFIEFFNDTTGIINQTSWDALQEGFLTITFYANDSKGYIGFKDVQIFKDLSFPVITVIRPQNGDVFGVDPPYIEVIIEDVYLDECGFFVNDTLVFSRTFRRDVTSVYIYNMSIGLYGWEDKPDGDIAIEFYAVDALGRNSSITVIVKK